MSRPNAPTGKALNWPAYSEPVMRHWFEHKGERAQAPRIAGDLVDPDMVWVAKPTGKRGRQPDCSGAAVRTCLSMKVLFGMALRAFSRPIGVHALRPPRKNAKPWKAITAGAVARNEALRASKHLGRALWRRWSRYHR